ncbi:hypothetical protein [uncultured Aureimonas sp.]|uniref:hypothetical protein n=1 Tax=uncultured Aureimonas sp. TaxID=1604662 RepID=UPI0025F9DA0A|nr:hypothetical protein [uncultured Aureimonas sp.]
MLRQALLALCLTPPLALPAVAQDVDPADVLVTADQLATVKKEADDALAADNCEAALPALDSFVKKAEVYAALIYAGARSVLESPRITAFPSSLINQMNAPTEDRLLILKMRNEGWVSIAECRVKVGQPEAAVEAYLEALRLLDAGKEQDTWNRARIGLWKLIGVIPE